MAFGFYMFIGRAAAVHFFFLCHGVFASRRIPYKALRKVTKRKRTVSACKNVAVQSALGERFVFYREIPREAQIEIFPATRCKKFV